MSDNHIDKVSIWSKAVVRQKAYLLTNEQRYASTKHGAICTLIDPANLIKTLVASWSYKLIARGDNLLFKPNWFEEYSTISDHLGFTSLDHMINYTNRDWEKAKCCKVSLFILKSLTSFCMMGFRREPSLVF